MKVGLDKRVDARGSDSVSERGGSEATTQVKGSVDIFGSVGGDESFGSSAGVFSTNMALDKLHDCEGHSSSNRLLGGDYVAGISGDG